MQTNTLTAEPRKVFGRKVKKLREEGILPANIFGKKIKSEAIKLNLSDFEKVLKQSGETKIVELKLGKSKKPVLIHNTQKDPVSDTIIHADFLQVDLKEKVTAQVPIELIGASPAEKEGKGVVVQQIDEVEVESLPTDLPEKFEIDLSPLADEDDAILIKDLKVDSKKVEIKNEKKQVIVKVEQPKEEEEVAPPAVSEDMDAAEKTEEEEREEKKAEEVPKKETEESSKEKAEK